jgi:acyl-CoA synthetase (AMP-forming)/AMP-acid ligase II
VNYHIKSNIAKFEKNIEQNIQDAIAEHFAKSVRFDDVYNIMIGYWHKQSIHIHEHLNGFTITTGDMGITDEEHHFFTFAQAFDFAMKTYTEKLQAK